VEMGAWDAAEAHARLKPSLMPRKAGQRRRRRAFIAEDAAAVWRVRESALARRLLFGRT